MGFGVEKMDETARLLESLVEADITSMDKRMDRMEDGRNAVIEVSIPQSLNLSTPQSLN